MTLALTRSPVRGLLTRISRSSAYLANRYPRRSSSLSRSSKRMLATNGETTVPLVLYGTLYRKGHVGSPRNVVGSWACKARPKDGKDWRGQPSRVRTNHVDAQKVRRARLLAYQAAGSRARVGLAQMVPAMLGFVGAECPASVPGGRLTRVDMMRNLLIVLVGRGGLEPPTY